MSNKNIADTLSQFENVLTIADSAEPKSIDEIRLYGVNITAATKGPGSIRQGIQFIQDKKISVTRRSGNLIKEYQGYFWKTNRDGDVLNEPNGGLDHALDAVRYAMTSLYPVRNDDIEYDYYETPPLYSSIGI